MAAVPQPPPAAAVRLERLPLHTWLAGAVVALSIACAALQTIVVRPYLWPAGVGARLEPDVDPQVPLRARPPDLRREIPLRVVDIVPGGPADRAGIHRGTSVLVVGVPGAGRVDLRVPSSDPERRIAAWRDLYWTGTTGTVEWTVADSTGQERTVPLAREPAWRAATAEWARGHLAMSLQVVVFTGCALVLLLMRGYDLTAALAVAALALSAVAGGGPLLGAERLLPLGGEALTVLTWIATPLAFPAIALAILYFPSRSALLGRHPILHAIPLLVVTPMLVPELASALYLCGLDAARPLAMWNAAHPGVYSATFAAAVALNMLVVVEGLHRFRRNPNANERRRIRLVVYTGVPGVLAYAVKDGLPVSSALLGVDIPEYPLAVLVTLQAIVLLPAFGLVYAVGVARVLGPRVVLRRSLQYALASRTLTILGMLPIAALAVTLVRQRDRTLVEIVTGASGLHLVVLALAAAAFRYRERARRWLDQRFFREEYDARRILLALTERIRPETDPRGLAILVASQIDEALHPRMVALLAGGVEAGRLVPLVALHREVDPLPLDAGLAAMLRWSAEPLEVLLDDRRTPAGRLPQEDRDWLERSGASLIVPVTADDGALLAMLVLGERRSEEAYTHEDRELLAGLAAQVGLGFDVARLRQTAAGESVTAATPRPRAFSAIAECPRCGRCEEESLATCPVDGATLQRLPTIPLIVEDKYRLEQLLGRGGMGSVYRARDLRLGRAVAIKIVRPDLLGDADALRRFRREAQIVASLQHPSVVAVYDYGSLPTGGAYLVMELVNGEDLRHLLEREGPLDAERVVQILAPVCGAVEAAHREGILHRDLKPENILLPVDGSPPKVLDFGVAKVVEDAREAETGVAAPPTLVTGPGVIVGTPAYMAPEQFTGSDADARTDVFSLGVVAYEMLTGRLPFGRGPLSEIMLAQTRGLPRLPDETLPPGLVRAVRMALEPDPDRRPPSPQAFGHLLGSALRPS